MRSGFFNSELMGYDVEGMPVFDRAEDAEFFSKYFSQFISNGIFPNPSNNMQVLAVGEMKVKVDIGVCYINGKMGWVEPAEAFEIEESDLQARIDRIVARLDYATRDINLFVKKGTASGNPVAPDIQRDYDIYEIALADIRVNANVIEITQENITDLRLNTALCGIVANQLQHVDTTTIFNQYQDWLRRVTGEAETNLNNMQEEFENSFNTWFQTVQDILDEDVAGHLLNLIDDNALRCKTITLSTENWTINNTTQEYEYAIVDNTVTQNHLMQGHMDLENQAKMSDGYIETYDGGFKVITSEMPKEQIVMNISIQKVGGIT